MTDPTGTVDAMADELSERLFVYGSLAPGASNEHVLADLAGQWEPAWVTGALVDEGWAAVPDGYPALVLREEGPVVNGLLFTSGALGSTGRASTSSRARSTSGCPCKRGGPTDDT